jgi:hypothetical protein
VKLIFQVPFFPISSIWASLGPSSPGPWKWQHHSKEWEGKKQGTYHFWILTIVPKMQC